MDIMKLSRVPFYRAPLPDCFWILSWLFDLNIWEKAGRLRNQLLIKQKSNDKYIFVEKIAFYAIPKKWDQDPGVGPKTLGWDPRVRPWGGTLG